MKHKLFLIVAWIWFWGCRGTPKMIAQEEAVKIATDDAGGFLGTWVDSEIIDGNWHISGYSKSAHPPMLYIIDAELGTIKLKLDNKDNPDQAELLSEFLKNGNRK